MKYIKKLMLLTLAISSVLILPAKSFAQTKTSTIPTPLYDSLLKEATDGRAAISLLKTWQDEAAALENEAARKETVLKDQIRKNIDCYRAKDTLTAAIKVRDDIINSQDIIIKKVGVKPKRFGIGPAVGYGYGLGSEVRRGGFVGAVLTYSLIRF